MNYRLFCITQYNPFVQSNASSNRWRTIAEGLQKRGYDITIFITNGFLSFTEYRRFGNSGKTNGIKYYYSLSLLNSNLWFRRINKYILLRLLSNKQRKELVSELEKIRPDITWVTASESPIRLFCTTFDSKIHHFKVFHEINEYPDISFLPGTFIHNLYFNRFINQVDLLVCMTEALIKYFGSIPLKNGVRIHHMPMTVDMSRFEAVGLKYEHEKPYMAYCGGLNNDKDGIDILLTSFAMLLSEYNDLKLLIAGPKEYDGNKILKQIRSMRLSDKVMYLGILDRDEIPGLLCNAELLALPRPSSRQAQGGFPTKLGEYLASGRPVCVTRFGELPKYLKDEVNVFYSDPDSAESFSDSIRRVLRDRKNAEEVGIRGKDVAIRNFSSEVQTDLLYEFIQRSVIR